MPYHDLLKGRVSLRGHYYMTTTVTAHRQAFFQSAIAGRLVLDACAVQESEGRAQTLACVVMPDHVHWLLSLSAAMSLSEVMRRFKGCAARDVNLVLGRSGALWQKGFHDHAIRSDECLEALARYLIDNPVRAGLVSRLSDYPLWRCVWDVSD